MGNGGGYGRVAGADAAYLCGYSGGSCAGGVRRECRRVFYDADESKFCYDSGGGFCNGHYRGYAILFSQ